MVCFWTRSSGPYFNRLSRLSCLVETDIFNMLLSQVTENDHSVLTNFLSGYDGTDMIAQNGTAGWSKLKDKLHSTKWTLWYFHYHLTKFHSQALQLFEVNLYQAWCLVRAKPYIKKTKKNGNNYGSKDHTLLDIGWYM